MFPQLPAAVRVFLCTRPTDMRKSFDGLLGMVHEHLGQDPLSGHLFLFLNRRRDRVKILFWEPDGLVIWYKRLEAGTFQKLDPATRPIAARRKPASSSPQRTWLCSSPESIWPRRGDASATHAPAECRRENIWEFSNRCSEWYVHVIMTEHLDPIPDDLPTCQERLRAVLERLHDLERQLHDLERQLDETSRRPRTCSVPTRA